MSKKIMLLIILVIGAYAQEQAQHLTTPEDVKMQDKFERFMRKYKKVYGSPEEQEKRFHIFKHNVKLSDEMAAEEGNDFYGVTKFFDLDEREFETQFLNLDRNYADMVKAETEFEDYSDEAMEAREHANSTENSQNSDELINLSSGFIGNNTDSDDDNNTVPDASDDDFESENPEDDPNFDHPTANATNATNHSTETDEARNLQGSVPKSWDWRAKGAVSYVRNQGVCGSCWAFTTVANIEGLYYNKYKVLKALSEQQLVDCNHNNAGCSGGTLPKAFTYVKNAGGVNLRSSYPYIGKKSTCKFNTNTKFGLIKGYVSPGMSETAIKNMLYQKGPLAAAINARPLHYYRGGVFKPTTAKCNPYAVNHGVVIVGYGTENGVDYWIVKNSWGPNWGEKGFFRISRGSGACGINRMVYSGVIN